LPQHHLLSCRTGLRIRHSMLQDVMEIRLGYLMETMNWLKVSSMEA
jgi:hypothetical protein